MLWAQQAHLATEAPCLTWALDLTLMEGPRSEEAGDGGPFQSPYRGRDATLQ